MALRWGCTPRVTVCLVTLVMVVVVVVRYSPFHWEGARDEKIYRRFGSAALQTVVYILT
jgi:hypothetical protein